MNAGLLSEPTLVLNRSWFPVRVCSVRRALTLSFKGLASIISTEDFVVHDFDSWLERGTQNGERYLQSVRCRISVPEVITLRTYDRFVQPRVVFSRRNLMRRDHYTCQYCAKRFPVDRLSIDHVVPRSLGGSSSWTNCVVACTTCNARKGNRRPDQIGMRTLRPPREPSPQMALNLQLGARKPSWERFVSRGFWAADGGEGTAVDG